jgi:hypothetical protein
VWSFADRTQSSPLSRRSDSKVAKPAWSGVIAPPATGRAISYGIVRAGARPTARMGLSAAGLDDDRSNGGGRERGLDLALGIACGGFSSGKPAFADGPGALVARGAGAGSGNCAAGPLKATG